MTEKNLPSVEYLRKRLRYEPETGKLFWLSSNSSLSFWENRYVGKEAFATASSGGYLSGVIDRYKLLTHRVIYAIYHGSWPSGHIDHINGNRKDNRISNLRAVSVTENMRNKKKYSNNKSGISGVYFDKYSEKWRATICLNKRQIHIGTFCTIEEATSARAAVAQQHGFTHRHGT